MLNNFKLMESVTRMDTEDVKTKLHEIKEEEGVKAREDVKGIDDVKIRGDGKAIEDVKATEDVKSKENAKPSAESWWDWTSGKTKYYPPDDAPDSEKKSYLDGLVPRCLFIDSVSPAVTANVLVAALDQFVDVEAVKLLKSPLTQTQQSGLAIVAVANLTQAKVLKNVMGDSLFMIGGLPRSARCHFVKEAMLMDHPFRINKCVLRFVNKDDDDATFAFAKRRKFERHDLEASCLLQAQKQREEDLASQQDDAYLEYMKRLAGITKNPNRDEYLELKELFKNYNLLR
ncbi:ASI1-immunoprecipitated protein 1 isoform X1 [Physcomitrium patens]|uniref:RRM domain-containing protein n=3 Tax=Physcomitrium patens TaxID=3218 RepID=A0A7I4A5U9_PHYPA|nr:uncharacterized protein LOC112288059 isoform X1 [Physcomitrium patens]|eukprot:XP_024387620.1 uncharacterized protein LOC112288059 isoform X1 [Physcomitrella patens]